MIPPVTETTLVVAMVVAFLAGIILGYAFRHREHEREIEAILNLTRPDRQKNIVQTEKKRGPQGPPPPKRKYRPY